MKLSNYDFNPLNRLYPCPTRWQIYVWRYECCNTPIGFGQIILCLPIKYLKFNDWLWASTIIKFHHFKFILKSVKHSRSIYPGSTIVSTHNHHSAFLIIYKYFWDINICFLTKHPKLSKKITYFLLKYFPSLSNTPEFYVKPSIVFVFSSNPMAWVEFGGSSI